MSAGEHFDLPTAIAAFVRTRWLAARLKSRAALEAHQQRSIARWLSEDVGRVSFYSHMDRSSLSALPVVDKAVVMANFAAFNRPGLSADEGWAHFRGGTSPRGLSIGASTGTSGNRGLYVISARERVRWLGTMLAKTMPGFPIEKARVAVILPQNAALYRQPGSGRRLALRFFDLHQGFNGLAERLQPFAPDTIVAPPKVLRMLAGEGKLQGIRRIFSGAEVLDPLDKEALEAGFGLPVREIYMATEGLLAVSCRHGRLHLAEDVMHFDLEPGPEGSGLVSPVISDFYRATPIMSRYRIKDLLRLSATPCSCGSPMRVVEEIVGRNDDVLELPSLAAAGRVRITPDVIRNTILNAEPSLRDFRCDQTHADRLLVRIPPEARSGAVDKIGPALQDFCRGLGAAVTITVRQEDFSVTAEKLRRVRRLWKGADT